MKIILISMPDVVPIIIHETAVHMPNHDIASVGGNIDADHEVYLIDLIRKRRSIKKHLIKTITKTKPDLIGLSSATDYKKYNGLWANVRTKHLDSAQLQYHFWRLRQEVLGWWDPPGSARKQGRLWTSIWRFVFKPILKLHYQRIMKKEGWEGRYQKEVSRWEKMNRFTDLERY